MEPLDWVRLLAGRLRARRARLDRLDAYYRGQHPLAFASAKFYEAFGGRFAAFSDNWCSLVVDVVLERLVVRGFRWGEESGDDRDAWGIWQANDLDARAHLGLKEALIHGVAYLTVWPRQDREPRIAVDHPRQTIVAYAVDEPDQRDAALKLWSDRGVAYATLYLPDAVYKFRSARREDLPLALPPGVAFPEWVRREVDGEEWPLPNPIGEVPVVPLVNRPRILDPAADPFLLRSGGGAVGPLIEREYVGDGVSEIVEIAALQDGINKTLADALVASEFVAYPQRYVTGFAPEKDPVTGEVRLPWDAGVDRVWWQKNPDARFGDFAAADLGNYVKLIEMLIQHVASISRTPPHYFGQISGQFPSGESLKSAEAGLVAKSLEKQLFFGEGLEEAVRLAFLAKDPSDERGARTDGETIWADPESRTEGEHIDALLKQKSLGIPEEILWEKAGYSPQEIRRIEAARDAAVLREADLLYAAERDALPGRVKTLDPDEILKRANAAGTLVRSGYDPADALRAVGLDPIKHSGVLPVTVQNPDA